LAEEGETLVAKGLELAKTFPEASNF